MIQRQLKYDDYMHILRQRKWVLIIPALLAGLGGYLASYAFAPRYTSQALLLVAQQQVPQGLVKSVVTEQLVERIANLQGRIQSRDRLLPIAQRAGLIGNGSNPQSVEEVLDEMRSNIALTPVESNMVPSQVTQRTGTVPGFFITYTSSNPHIAQQVCSDLTSAFIDEDLKLRGQIAEGTTSFFNSQLEEAKRNQDELAAKLATFKSRYFGQLPDQQDENMKILASLNTQLDAATQALARAQQDKVYAASVLNQQLATWKMTQNGSNPQTLRQQLATMQAQLLSLQARYTPEYPDIIKLKKNIAEVQQQIKNPNNGASAASTPEKGNVAEPLELQKLRAQVHQYDAAIQQLSAQQSRLQKQIKLYESRLEVSPSVQEQYGELTRDYASAQKFYSDLASKQQDSELAADMEKRQQGEQLRLSDPADLPVAPSFPNAFLFAGGGLGAGCFLGLGLMLYFEVQDQTIQSERDIEAILELPTFIAIPWISEAAGVRPNGHNGSGADSRIEADHVIAHTD